ncbi:NUDIX domain-containing protein [Pedobacter sp. SYSU D00535]|uniref:NUDIX domain-containing protein n=1 Tax=Pedobacter sp. SYSU D00535 TaxID=2810308 RepID=UPI001A976D6E|nr:NUDIX domain-containing protein [Pedobacter sp. SYSU D00535]
MPEVKIIEQKTLSENHSKLELFRIEKTEKGKTVTQEREIFFRPAATTILLYDPDRRTVLLTRQFRLPVYLGKDEAILEACAGLIDEGEFPEHAVVREVEEETGYRISEIEKVAEAYTSPAAFSEYVHFYFGKYSPDMKVNSGGGLEDEGEQIELVELSAQEAREKLLSGKIKDVKTIVLLQHAIIKNLI